jgi:CheY-like chemotaxis protein
MLSVAIIDSNLENIKLLARILRTFGVTDIVWAQDGGVGLRTIIDKKPDMALVNVDLPTLTGYSLSFSVSLEEDLEDIVMVALADYDISMIRDEALDIGFHEVMGFAHAPMELLNILGKYYVASA